MYQSIGRWETRSLPGRRVNLSGTEAVAAGSPGGTPMGPVNAVARGSGIEVP